MQSRGRHRTERAPHLNTKRTRPGTLCREFVQVTKATFRPCSTGLITLSFPSPGLRSTSAAKPDGGALGSSAGWGKVSLLASYFASAYTTDQAI